MECGKRCVSGYLLLKISQLLLQGTPSVTEKQKSFPWWGSLGFHRQDIAFVIIVAFQNKKCKYLHKERGSDQQGEGLFKFYEEERL